jgi:phosphocarrier protein HPr
VIRVELLIENRLGLHARAAARFVHTANEFEAHIAVKKEHMRVNGKSILGLLTLAAACGTRVTLMADGPDEELAIQTLTRLIHSRFGEES